MNDHIAALMILLGALLICSGCTRPLDVAAATANAAAVTLKATRAELVAARAREQADAAGRVRGDRAEHAVRAEQLDRAAAVGKRYQDAFTAYDVARAAWVALVAAIQVAAQLDEAGGVADVEQLAQMISILAAAQRELLTAAKLLEDSP